MHIHIFYANEAIHCLKSNGMDPAALTSTILTRVTTAGRRTGRIKNLKNWSVVALHKPSHVNDFHETNFTKVERVRYQSLINRWPILANYQLLKVINITGNHSNHLSRIRLLIVL